MTVRETTDTNPDDDENQPEADQSSLANYYGRNDPTTHETNYMDHDDGDAIIVTPDQFDPNA